ncbi:hypothetical protein [Streptomyces sp. BE133]|uniref:hypothetical protein n=1 Tax=Streptomyces sp. BE133 TaxID=3002523 RepID=UPI002E75C189|nr:hypothetical protein [Streptomyces sp. BE133]MEE1807053.1 hypothetical protein [Streptomyces sp. BE133]
MTPRPHPLRRSLALCCVSVAFAAFTVGCSSDSGGPSGPSASESSPGRQQKGSAEASGRAEERLGKQVQEVLGTEEVSDSDPLFVESGLERVGDGLHTEPELARGRTYELAVACAGKGKITLSIALKNPVHQTVNCDGVPFRQRITASAGKAGIDAEGMPGATGMVAWRLDKVDK